MDKELKSKWVAALRSGNFQQGTGRLLRDGKYCCLGVLCSVAGAQWGDWPDDAGERRWADDLVPLADGVLLSDEENSELNAEALRRFGIAGDTESRLIAMNDGQKLHEVQFHEHSFHEIADWIEANL